MIILSVVNFFHPSSKKVIILLHISISSLGLMSATLAAVCLATFTSPIITLPSVSASTRGSGWLSDIAVRHPTSCTVESPGQTVNLGLLWPVCPVMFHLQTYYEFLQQRCVTVSESLAQLEHTKTSKVESCVTVFFWFYFCFIFVLATCPGGWLAEPYKQKLQPFIYRSLRDRRLYWLGELMGSGPNPSPPPRRAKLSCFLEKYVALVPKSGAMPLSRMSTQEWYMRAKGMTTHSMLKKTR